MEIKIPNYAKEEAKKSLKLRDSLPKSKKFGIDKTEASRLKIASGVERAKQIMNNKRISVEDAKKVARFYSRFKNCKTDKCKGAVGLWGGEKWGNKLYEEFYE